MWKQQPRYPYHCERCGTNANSLTALRDHPCSAAPPGSARAYTESNVDMGNVGVCDKCGQVFKTDIMGDVIFRFNVNLRALEAKLCPEHCKELYDWFQDSPVSANASKPFDPNDLDSDTAKAIGK